MGEKKHKEEEIEKEVEANKSECIDTKRSITILNEKGLGFLQKHRKGLLLLLPRSSILINETRNRRLQRFLASSPG
ncbi:hypothetical protein Nepgr_031982 [Nepenthes gracilis]|uniref:Uncharacterized protein n=1 Tax=Nepenthes gracilis TaxID=150966 RepID=A0AAD3TJ99_NEPGR|nr:hypothetical protein Nepgr_031982 [Nepenthes gracilis]